MNILMGVTGGIAIYKTLTVIRLLNKRGHNVKAVMTKNAAKFINPILFKTISNNEVYLKEFNYNHDLAHITLTDWADVFAVVPATANTLAKFAHGIADNLLTSTALAFTGRKALFPAMNERMYENPVTQENINKLIEMGYEVCQPDSGFLACGYNGIGRLPSEEFIAGIIDRDITAPLKGKKYIVTAGGAIEKIDPVRYISNFSSGKMGFELAKALFRKGADVLIVYANTSKLPPAYIDSIEAVSTQDTLDIVDKNLEEYDGLYMAAAPSDFKVKNYSSAKIKKSDSLSVAFIKNPDILKELSKKYSHKLLVGFALETNDFIGNAEKKLKEKKLDYIVLNKCDDNFNPMGNEKNSVTLISKNGDQFENNNKSKEEIAEWLVDLTLRIEDMEKR